jgi:hypothetical protein
MAKPSSQPTYVMPSRVLAGASVLTTAPPHTGALTTIPMATAIASVGYAVMAPAVVDAKAAVTPAASATPSHL